jgi:hypothetical protein
MNCEDARDGLSVLVGAHIGLTEWALLEAHLKQCAECREAEAHLRQLAAASRPVTRPRAVLASLRKAMELLRIGVTCSTALVVRRRALLTAAARELTPRAIAGVMRAFGLGITRGVAEIAHLRRIRFGPAPPRPELGPTPLEPAQVESARLEPTRLEPAQAQPAQLGPSLPAPSIEKKTVSVKKTVSAAPPRTDEPRQTPSVAPPRAAPLSPPDVSASEPVRGVAPPLRRCPRSPRSRRPMSSGNCRRRTRVRPSAISSPCWPMWVERGLAGVTESCSRRSKWSYHNPARGTGRRRALPGVRDLDPLALGGIFDLSRFTPDNASVSMTRGAHTVE